MKFKPILREGIIYGKSKAFTHKDVSNIANKCDFNFEDVFDFILQLLEDINAHDLLLQLEKEFEYYLEDMQKKAEIQNSGVSEEEQTTSYEDLKKRFAEFQKTRKRS